ncbi:hypothetical protein F5Y07DRAFT_372103 [Xylaria sp. FL0933]|nr:hypothetical protein F5Y07DRAFT_372103 [Xylaria sp. FL0933]
MAAERDLSHQSGDRSGEEVLEAPIPSDVEPWPPSYKDGEQLRLDFSESGASYTESSTSASEDSLDSFYKTIGYLSPLSDSTLELLEQVLADPTMGANGGRVNPSDVVNFQDGLGDRNVALESCHDPYLDQLKSLSPEGVEEPELERERHELAWNNDLNKSQKDPNELIFHRTILMSMIDRHRFIYKAGEPRTPVLDFAVQRTWKCLPMPSMAFRRNDTEVLTAPKPDLALAFDRDAIFDPIYWSQIPPLTRQLFCYEGDTQGSQVRVFHFMTIEAKSSFKTLDDQTALSQVLNNSSQSLHVMYELFREAGEEHLQTFFDKVRVFSAIATGKGIKVNVHRACRIEEHDKDTQANDVPHMVPIVGGYPLQFLYDNFFETSGNDFTRDKVVAVFEKIMVGYAIGELRGYLRDAAAAVEAKCLDYNREHQICIDRDMNYYLYGMPLPLKRHHLGSSVTTEVTRSALGTSFQRPEDPDVPVIPSLESPVPNLTRPAKRQRSN